METQQKNNLWDSNIVKLILVILLILILLIPLQYVKSLIYERSQRKNEVVAEVSEKHGEKVKFYGPIVKIPYKKFSETTSIDVKTNKAIVNQTSETKYAYFFPDLLTNTGNIKTDLLHRGIYQVSVFNTQMAFKGNFGNLDFSKSDIKPEHIIWEKATIMIKTTNLKSIKNQVNININNQKYGFEPVRISDNSNYEILETNQINLKETNIKNFNFDISYDGSQQLMFIPIGKTTKIALKSNWKDPSFDGYFLTDSKIINNNGFEAKWTISHINRAFSQQYFEALPNLDEYLFGVNFVIPVDEYQKSERASKYGFLVIGLTFLIFFLIQTIS
ncbi:MAG: cell envelope integrity protein CreD, partial [Flavobacterium sp.]